VSASLLLVGVTAASSVASAAAAEPSGDAIEGTSSTIHPNGVLPPAAPISAAERARLARHSRRPPTSTTNRGAGRAVGADDSPETTEAPGSRALSITRNNRNAVAQFLGDLLAEPAAATDGSEVFFGGNTYFSRSLNNGANWTYEAIPGGPADAPNPCCDLDAVHHNGLDTTFISVLYLNSARNNGVVRIFVRRGTIAGGADCSYDIDPGGSSPLTPDYPHIAVSNNFVYLTTNNLSPNWTGAQIRRFNASQMANCQQSVATTTINYVGTDGQRVLVPVENASTNMYFGLNRSANLFRILRLPESSSTLTPFDRTLSHGTNFPQSDPDCRGGVGDHNWMSLAVDITGFDLRGAIVPGNRLWFMWNAGNDFSHPYAHLHSAIFSEPGLATLASPSVWSSTECFAYPALGANSSGEFGLTFAAGGRAGGGGSAAQGAVAVDDSQSAGNTFPTFTVTAAASHNPLDERFGDYFTIRPNNKCFGSYGWGATNYGLAFGNTRSSNVNARYVEFQSSTHPACP
jgi:hypothetical protein